MIGDSIAPTRQTTTIMSVPGVSGADGQSVSINDYNSSWDYLNKKDGMDKVQLQQASQVVLPRAQSQVEELNRKYVALQNDVEFNKKLSEAKEQYRYDNPPVTAGRFVERTPGVMVYSNQLREAKNEANESLQAMKDAKTSQEFNTSQARFEQANNKLNKLYSTDPSSVEMVITERVVKEPTGYPRFASAETGWIQPHGESEESYQARQTQQAMSNMLKGFATTGQRPTDDQLQDYANAVVRSGGVVSIHDPALKPFFTSGSPVSTPTQSDFKYKPVFDDVLSKEEIERGLADPNLTTRGRLFLLNEADKLRENVIGYSSQYHHWANSQKGPTLTNPWSHAGDTALNQQQRSRGITGRSLTQLPSYQDYKNIATNDIINPSTVLANIPIQDNSNWLKTINNSNIDKPYQPVQKDTNVAGFNFDNPPVPFLSTIGKPAQSVKTGGLGFISLTNALGNEVNKKLAPDSGIPLSTPAQTNRFYPTGQISLNPNDIQTNAPYEDVSISKSESWLSNLPVGVGKYGGILGIPFSGLPNLPQFVEGIFPTSSFKTNKDAWDLSNIPSANAPNIITTTKHDKPLYITGMWNKEGQFIKNTPQTYISKPMSDTDSKLLSQYNADVKSFNTDVEVYTMLKNDYELKGKSDPGTFAYLNNQFINLQAREESLLKTKDIVDTIPPVELTAATPFNTTITPSTTTHEIGKSDLQMAKRGIIDATYGKFIPEYKHIQGSGVGEEVLNTLGGIYNYARNEPDELLADFVVSAGIGYGFSAGESMLGKFIAKSATSKLPVVSTAGRLGSTPTAMSAGTLAKLTLGGAYATDVVHQLKEAPDAEGRGKVAIQTIAQVKGFKAGSFDAPIADNPYAGKEFFSGERKLPQTTQARNYLLTKIQKPFSTSPSAFEDVSTIFRETRYLEPQPGIKQVTAPDGTLSHTGLKPFKQPDISEISTIGPKRASAVTKGLEDLKNSGTVMVAKGSSVVRSQVSGMESGKTAGRQPKDLDMLGSKEKLSESLAKHGETIQGFDIKPFEAGYPEVPGMERGTSTYKPGRKISWINKLLGYPIRIVQGEKLPYSDEILLPGRDYKGVIGSEKLQAQAARKAQALQQDLVPGNEAQFRVVKDSLDFYNLNKDLIHSNQAKAGVKVGTVTKELQLLEGMKDKVVKFDFVPEQDVPALGARRGVRFNKEMTFREMWEKYNRLDNAGKKVFEYADRPDTLTEQLKSQGSVGSVIRSTPPGFIHSSSPSNIDYHKSSLSPTPSSMISSISRIQSGVSSITSPSKVSSPSISSISSPSIIPSSITSPSPSPRPSSVTSPSPSSITSPSVSPSISPSLSGYLYSTSITSPPPSHKPPKPPKIPGVPFLAAPGGAGGGGRGSRARSIRIINPINPLTVVNKQTANRFSKVFGSGMKAFNNMKDPGRGNMAPTLKIKSPAVGKHKTDNSISNNITGMFNDKKKKGRVF